MRLGGPLHTDVSTPGRWIEALREQRYRAAYCPLLATASERDIAAYARAAADADIVIAEVGAWSNPLSPDPVERAAAIDKCKTQLTLAERIGARCCVNIAGSRGAHWDGPHPENLSTQTFDMIVETTRAIIDAVKPERTFFTLETMPWIFPDSVESYARLITAIDRPRFGVHLDPVNLVNCPHRFYDTAGLARACVAQLGPHIKSVHVKDIVLHPTLMVHLDEVRPGLGSFDHATLLRALDPLDADLPVMLEHLPDADAYALAAAHLRMTAASVGITL
jgi:sugar phosphate isomerase/epimerase